MHKTRELAILFFFFVSTSFLVLISGLSLRNSMDTRSRAEDVPTPTGLDCASDTQREDYCGDSAPFRGCVGGIGGNEWFCQCRLPSGKWWSECSIIESADEKQKYITQCGGDKEKAYSQWKYDVASAETGGKCTCGGQNICGSLIPTRPAGGGGGGGGNFPPGESPPPFASPVIDTPIPSPTLTYRVPTQPIAPTRIYVPPTSNPIYVVPTVQIQPTVTPIPTSKPIVNIDLKKNVETFMSFVGKTQKSLSDFFSKVLP